MFILGKTIRQAQQAYYLANGAYTTDITELDISVPCEVTRYTEDDTLGQLACKNSVIYMYPGFLSPHLTSYPGFWINMNYADGSSLCSARDQTAEELCVSLGGTYSYTDGEGIKRYVL